MWKENRVEVSDNVWSFLYLCLSAWVLIICLKGGYLAPIAPLPLEGKVTSGKNLELFLGYVKVRGVYVVILVLIDAGREIWGGRSTKEYEEVNS